MWFYHEPDFPWAEFTLIRTFPEMSLPWAGFSLRWVYPESDYPSAELTLSQAYPELDFPWDRLSLSWSFPELTLSRTFPHSVPMRSSSHMTRFLAANMSPPVCLRASSKSFRAYCSSWFILYKIYNKYYEFLSMTLV